MRWVVVAVSAALLVPAPARAGWLLGHGGAPLSTAILLTNDAGTLLLTDQLRRMFLTWPSQGSTYPLLVDNSGTRVLTDNSGTILLFGTPGGPSPSLPILTDDSGTDLLLDNGTSLLLGH